MNDIIQEKTETKASKIRRVPAGAENYEMRRVSKRYIITEGVRGIKGAILPIIIILGGTIFSGLQKYQSQELDASFPFEWIIGPAVTALLIIFPIIIAVMGYLSEYWFLTDKEIIYCKGIIRRTVTRMPYEKIHAINTNASLIDRLLGVSTLKVDTAGGTASGDVSIKAVRNVDAEVLRNDIQVHMYGIAAPRAEADPLHVFSEGTRDEAPKDVSSERIESEAAVLLDEDIRAYKLTAKEILLAGISNGRTLIYLLIALGVAFQIINNLNITDYVVEHAGTLWSMLLERGALFIVLIAVVVLILSWAISVISFALKNYGFSVKTYTGRIEITRGLTKRVSMQINLKRIQSVRVTQSIMARIFGYATIKADLATSISSNGDNSNNQAVSSVPIHPFIKKDRVDGYIAAFLPEYELRPRDTDPLPASAMGRSVLRYARWGFIFFVAPLVAAIILLDYFDVLADTYNIWMYIIIAVIYSFILFSGYRAYKGRRLKISVPIVVIKRGAYKTETVYIPRRKIQIAEIKQNPFQRMRHLMTLVAGTAATLHRTTSLRDVSEASAHEFIDIATSPENVRRTSNTISKLST